MKIHKKTLLIFVILLVAASIGTAFLFPKATRAPDVAEDAAGLMVSENGIYVAEQSPSATVSVALVRFERPGFVVIHEDMSEAPGKILGVSDLVMAGETKDPRDIALSRSTVDGETIYAMLHLDDGDGVFDATKDRPILDPVAGEPTMMIVFISKDAVEPSAVNP